MSSAKLLQCFALAMALQLVSAFDLSVMSYNLYGWNAFGANSWKAPNILNKMKHYAPDIMGCQEVEGNANWIAGDTVDATKGGFAVAGQHAGHAIFYRSNLFNVEDQGAFNINEQDQWGLRQLAWVKFLHKPSGQRFLHFNTHWCVCGEPQLFQTAQDVAHWVADVRARFNNPPAMLTGDFNVFGGCQNSKAIRYLTGQPVDGQQSPVVFFDANEGQGATYGGCKIDYVLLTGEWSVQESLIDRDHRNGAIGSDHDSLYAKLSVGSGGSPPAPAPAPPAPGSCEQGGSVWNAMANGHTCGDRIQWVRTNRLQGDLLAAKYQIASEYPNICGACASEVLTTLVATTTSSTTTLTTTSSTTTLSVASNSCEEGGSVWNTMANGHTCGSRIEWVSANQVQGDVAAAKEQVASEYPTICGACGSGGSTAAPGPSPPVNGGSCEEGGSVWNTMANGHTCGDRIAWVSANQL
jgi:endonuclease/exonuclease/phosphatase family metal-dependent hydrolase